VSLVGDEAYDVVLLLLTTAAFGHVLNVGWLGLTLTLPGLVVAPMIGAALDRHPARRVAAMRFADAVRALLVAVFALLLYETSARPVLYAFVVAVAMLGVVFTTASRASIPRIFASAERDISHELTNANAMFIAQSTAIQILAPALFAALLGFVDPSLVLLLDALTFVASYALLRGYARAVSQTYASTGSTARAEPEPAPKAGFWSQVRGGFHAVNRDVTARAVIIASAITGGVGFAVLLSIPTLMKDRSVGTWAVGIGLGAVACGAFLGSKAVRRAPGHQWRLAIVAFDPVIRALCLVVIAFAANAPVLIASLFVLGFSSGTGNVARLTLIQIRFPDATLGRVMSIFGLANQVLMPVMPIVWTVLYETVGLTKAYLIFGCLLASVVVVVLGARTVRREWVEAAATT